MAVLTNTETAMRYTITMNVTAVIAFVALPVLYVGYVTSVSVFVAVGGVVVASFGFIFVVVSSVLVGCFHMLPFLPPWVLRWQVLLEYGGDPVDNISARSEQCYDKYDITILA